MSTSTDVEQPATRAVDTPSAPRIVSGNGETSERSGEDHPTRDAAFDRRVGELRSFVEAHGRLPSHGSEDLAQRGLARWLERQRGAYRAGLLAPQRAAKLEATLPGVWTMRSGRSFEQRCEELSAFVSAHGRFPQCSGDCAEQRLSAWVGYQRWVHKTSGLPAERLAALQAIGDWIAAPRPAFAQPVAQLTAFVEDNGRLPSQGASDVEERLLGVWVAQRRCSYGCQDMLPDEIAALEQVPMWCWEPSADHSTRSCEQRIRDLTAFVEAHSRLPSPGARDAAERLLGIWAQRRRRSYRRQELSSRQIAALEQIPLWYWEPWHVQVRALGAFVDAHNRLPSAGSRDATELRIAGWIKTRRSLHAAKRLPAELAAMLEAIPRWAWEAPRVPPGYERRAVEVAAFVGDRGRFPSKTCRNDQPERRLGQWLACQRKDYNTHRLSPAHTAILDRAFADTGEWRRGTHANAVFAERVNELSLLVVEHQRLPMLHLEAQAAERSLAKWVSRQRRRYRRSTMTASEIATLEQIPGWWWHIRDRAVEHRHASPAQPNPALITTAVTDRGDNESD